MKIKDLPISVQTFKNIRTGNYIYIDKTEQIYPIVSKHYGAYFLSRPRRFGKSMTVSTMNELFSGNRELFKGLWIEDKWDWSQTYPVIHLSFDILDYRSSGLGKVIISEIRKIAERFAITLGMDSYKEQFQELIQKLSEKQGRVVVLIDEYDKPIIDYLEKSELPQAKINQAILKNFYSVLKQSERYLRMVFITGVSKFSKVSIFSDLNHLNDLTLNPNFSTLVGYTQTELEQHFEDYIQKVINIKRRAKKLSVLLLILILLSGKLMGGLKKRFDKKRKQPKILRGYSKNLSDIKLQAF